MMDPTIAQSFVTKNNFPGIIGAIDGSYIPIIASNEYHENFINRKSFHSIVLQVVCVERMIFLDIVVGWPGSVHDAQVLRTSSLYVTADEKCTPDCQLLGHSAYPLKTWLLTTYKDFGWQHDSRPTPLQYVTCSAKSRLNSHTLVSR